MSVVQEKDKITIGVLAGLIILVLIGGIWWMTERKNKRVVEPLPLETVGPKKGETGYKEPATKVAVGSKAVSGGTFEKAEAGKIYFRESGITTAMPLTDEVSIQCTTQDLAGVEEYDFNLVTKVKIVTPGELNAAVGAGESVVVLANYDGTQYKASTVAMDAAKCKL